MAGRANDREPMSLSPQAWAYIGAHLHLSNRELQVVRRVADDRTERSIGRELGISPHTVHTYLTRIFQKLAVNSRVDLVRCVMLSYVQLAGDPAHPLAPVCGRHARGECPFNS